MRIDINKYLKDLSEDNELYYHPNKGNAGDSLIACSTFQLFSKLELPFTLFNKKSFNPEGKVLIYGGGGNLIPQYHGARRIIKRYHRAVKKIVILPHTISGNEKLLATLGSNVDIFTREVTSFEHVRQHAPNANVFLEHDLAFGLDPEQLLSEESSCPYRDIPLKRLVRREAARLSEMLRRSCAQHLVLNCFRTDKEKTEVRRPLGNIDLSILFKYGTGTPQQALRTTLMLFRFMNRYDEIRTNRLHLAIAGALLGKVVQFHPNSYYKNRAVYEFSIKDRFPNVQWMER